MRDVDFVVEGNNQVSFSIGADMGDKKQLGPLRYDQMYDLKYLVAYPIIDSKHHCLHPTYAAERRFCK